VLDIAVVLGDDADEIRKNLSWFSGKVVVNQFSRSGRMSSILAGMHALEEKDLHGVLICPIDQPLVTQALLVGMLNQFWIKHRPVVVPVYKGRWGNPILIGKALFPELEKAPADSNVSAIFSGPPDIVLEYQTEDEGVVLSINSQEDYQEMIVKSFSKNRV
jgi:molybdenum cofactor cytidylyltransferase